MNIFLVCVLAFVAALVVTATVIIRRASVAPAGESNVGGNVALAAFLFLIAAPVAMAVLVMLQHEHGAQKTTVTIEKLERGDDPGIYVTARDGFFDRKLRYHAASDDGWVRPHSVSFEDSVIREGASLTHEITTTTVAGGDFWPWPLTVSETHVFTVPADAVAGFVPEKG